MIPVVTPSEMAIIDEEASEPINVLIERAGSAVAWHARQMLKGTYGKRVTVIAGKGNNGADGIVAAKCLRRWGVKVNVIQSDDNVAKVHGCDLLIDAAVGTGLKRPYCAPDFPGPVLSVDIPSGICGLTGEAQGKPVTANATITFQALKYGHLLADGPFHAGSIEIVDIGLDASVAKTFVLEKSDVAKILNTMSDREHKWMSACWVIGGSEGMNGAPLLSSNAALRTGSGYVRMSTPGGQGEIPSEIVGFDLPSEDWEDYIIASDFKRFKAIVVGPGLGKTEATRKGVINLLSAIKMPTVVDADALYALGQQRLDSRHFGDHIVLTPHDAEYEYLTGHRPQTNRVLDVRETAAKLNMVILLKGPKTIVAHPDGRCLIINNGDQRLATAGTGDVLSGVIAGFLARGISPFEAAAGGAWIHAEAANNCLAEGMIASDIIRVLPEVLNATNVG
tara:strand:- start:180 stop:1529 length:1350 start_codon:yes stop_codon:yes gene_type:complete